MNHVLKGDFVHRDPGADGYDATTRSAASTAPAPAG